MTFVFITLGYYPDSIGGAYRYVTEVAERLAARQHQVHVIYPRDASASVSSMELRNGVHLHRFPNASRTFFQNWLEENGAVKAALANLLPSLQEPALLVLCHAFFAPALKSFSGPSVFLFTGPWAEEFCFARQSFHRSLPHRALDGSIAEAMRYFERTSLRRVQCIVTISEYYLRALPKWHGPQLPTAINVSGGVDTRCFRRASDRNEARRKLGLTNDNFLFLTLRRLDPRMGLLGLIEAFALVANDHPGACLWLAGTGPQKDALQRKAEELGLSHRIRLIGFIPDADLPIYLSAADCCVMPSLDLEGFGLATLEALACGTPVVGSNTGATPELLGPLSPDLLFDAGSVTALAAKLHVVLSGQLKLPTPNVCRNYVDQNFSWSKPVHAFEKLWKELTAAQS